MAHCLPPDICFLCLSRDRKIFCLTENIRHLFGFLTDWYPQDDARVCWECRATLERLRRFKEQAKEAVCALERARTGLQPMSFVCLSKVCHTQTLYIDLLVPNDTSTVSNDDFPFDNSYRRISKVHEVKVEFEEIKPKTEGDITEEVDFGLDTIYTSDHIEDDNDVKTKSLVMIDLTDDTKYEIQQDTERANLPQTELQIYGPSTSAEEKLTSKTRKSTLAVKRKQGTVKTKAKRKKPKVQRVKWKFTKADRRINEESHALNEKYRLFQQDKTYDCDHCGKKLENRTKMVKHVKYHISRISCEQCSYKCWDQSRMKDHVLTHLEPSQRPLECQICHNRFTNKYKLLEHTRRHTGERPFKCDACDGAFVSKNDLVFHCNTKHVSRELREEMCAQAKKKPRFTNAQAPRKKSRPLLYNTTFKIIKNAESVTYECKVCKEIFPLLKAFRRHYTSAHKKQYPCAECNETFKFPGPLSLHVKTVHRGEKPHLCNICGVTRSTKQGLVQHMITHSDERNFKCNECSATFKYHCGLYMHKLIHRGDKPYQCEICEARFTLKSNLAGHMKVHTKDRPFECDICRKKFPWRRNLKNHLKTHFKEQQYDP